MIPFPGYNLMKLIPLKVEYSWMNPERPKGVEGSCKNLPQ